MKSFPTLRKWYSLVVAGAAALVMLAFMFSGTLAQEIDAPDSDALRQGDSNSCEPYFVTVDRANVRACALIGCRVMAQVSRDQSLCVVGESEDSSDWLRVDLDPADTASPIYYISTQVIAPGAPGQAQSGYTSCQSWLVDVDSVVVYACNQPGCAPLGTLQTEDWLCGHYYASFPTWVYVVDSDRGLSGWVQRQGLIPWSTNTGQPVPFVPTSTPAAGQVTFTPVVPLETLAPTVTPASEPLKIAERLPACQQYFVADLAASIRSCAGAGCPVVARLNQGEGVCVRGITDNPEWLLVSLASETADTEESAPLYAIEKSNVMPGLPPDDLITALFSDCEEYWGVGGTDNVNFRQCPSVTCPAMGAISPGDWVCVRDWGGEYGDWLRVDVPGGASDVWISDAVMTLLTDSALPQVALLQTQAAPSPTPAASATAAEAATAVATAAATEAATLADTVSTPEQVACVPYLVSVEGATGANVRSCASTTCEILEMYPQGATVCVLGVDPEDANWLVVERSPEQPGQDLAYISSGVVAPQTVPASVIGITPEAVAQVVLPTETPQATQPVCEPGSSLAGCVTMTPTPVLTPIPDNVPTGPLLAQEVKLSDLNIPNLTLQSPAALAQFELYVPETWVPAGNNVLYLNVDYFESRPSMVGPTTESQMVTIMNVTLDDQVIATVSLGPENVGVQTLAIPLPLNLLAQGGTYHTFIVKTQAEDHCLANALSQVLIKSDQSYFHLEFRESIPILDLSLYPRPLYTQRFIDRSDVLYMVLPADPTEHDIEVGLSLSAGLGSLTGNNLVIRVLTADALDETILRTNNLMLVGQIGKNALLDQYYDEDRFPSVLGADGGLSVAGEAVAAEDGVVQIIPNPGNELLSVVAVTGQTPEGLRKAATALAGPPSLMGIGGPVAIITEVRPVQRPPVGFTLESKVTFSQLGYPLITMGGYGVSTAQVQFYLPANYPLTEEAYVDLEFNYAGAINNNQSSVALSMNGNYPIASAVLNAPGTPITGAEGAVTAIEGGPYHLRARIPADSVLLGDQNSLDITVTVGGDWGRCFVPDPQVAWFTVSGNSVLNLPRGSVMAENVTPNIGTFPVPFNTQSDLRDVWLSLPDDPTVLDLEYAMRLTSRLGTSVTAGEGFAPRVSLGNALPEGTDLANYSIIVLGQNTTNSFLGTLNENLPQPFVEGTDTLRQVLDDVIYRIPTGYEVGVLELLPSPWSLDRVILVITGTGARGYANAAAVLNDYLYWRTELVGDVGYVSNTSLSMVDTRVIKDQEELAQEIQDVMMGLEAEATAVVQATGTAQVMATLVTATPEADATLTADSVVTVTPVVFPQVVVPTSPAGPTPLFTQTPVPTVPTAIPTFAPLPPTSLQPKDPESPGWLEGMLIAAGVLGVATLGFGLVRLMRQDRRR